MNIIMRNSIYPNPFTPKSGMEPRVFIGREKEIGIFERKLDEALKLKRYDHFLILGEWGIGKTSLLREFKKIAQANKVLTSYLPIREFQESDKFISATQHLISQIPRNLPVKYEILKNFMEYLRGIGISLPIIGGGVQLPEKIEVEGDPQVLLLDILERLWHAVKKETDVVVILLDDAQNYHPISGYLTIIKNVLSDDVIVKNTGFLFVLASTPEAWGQFLKKHHPIGRYFIPTLRLNRLCHSETLDVLDKILDATGVTFNDSIKSKIWQYTEGHPFELQILCSFLYDNQLGGKVTDDTWEVSLDMAITQIGNILFDHLYDDASPSEKEILKVISEEYKPVESKTITEKIKKFKNEAVNKYLHRLVSKKLLILEQRGVFALPDRMFREYVLRKF
ncbi:MAG: AAA family ATPase [bacterium]|nr:AAA family ATPase [bacterium]